MREKLLLDQEELGAKLGLPQSTVSDLELGRIAVPRFPFTVATLRQVFGLDTGYILYGRNPERYSIGFIRQRYIDTKFKTDRKKREPAEHWTHKRLKAGKSVRGQ